MILDQTSFQTPLSIPDHQPLSLSLSHTQEAKNETERMISDQTSFQTSSFPNFIPNLICKFETRMMHTREEER